LTYGILRLYIWRNTHSDIEYIEGMRFQIRGGNMNANGQVHTIIHGAASAAAAAASGLAQLPGSDNAVITPIQIAMIIAIAHAHGKNMEKAAALSVLSSVSAGIAGRTLSQFLIGWVPGFGNAMNATTAFAITEAIGWGTDSILSGETTATKTAESESGGIYD
jgi:uncharacterized protein (DUF697 family)